MFKQYLTFSNHRRVNAFNMMKIERFDLAWQTENNKVDCGVSLMRHMEMYRGGGVEKLYCDLASECTSQNLQLADLRKKYVGKILLSDHNLCKLSFVATLEDYDKLSTYKRKKIYNDKHVAEVQARVQGIVVL